MKTLFVKHRGILIRVLFLAFVFLFWDICHPEYLNYHEQNQLFLFSSDYLYSRIAIAGGLADYISEFLVQFFYYSWLGSLIIGLLLLSLQHAVFLLSDKRLLILSFLPSLLSIWALGNQNVLFSFFVALIIILYAAYYFRHLHILADLILIPLLFWAMGALVWIYVAIRCFKSRSRWSWLYCLYIIGIQLGAYITILRQWPLQRVLFGINYYRDETLAPLLLYLVAIVAFLVIVFSQYTNRLNSRIVHATSVLGAFIILLLAIFTGFDKDNYELLKDDMLVRQEKWEEIISRAENYQPHCAFSSESINLALGMTRQLADRMFDFYQSGTDAMIMPPVRDNFSNMISAETFFRLGMVNSALRYFSDLQESILNARKSGRLEQRITECYIVNGRYLIAQKHIDLLKQSLFYRSWAQEAEDYLNHETMIANHPVWGQMRKFHFKKDYLYSYPEIEKMFGQLFADHTDNKLALDYFMGGMLLKGDYDGFMNYMRFVESYGGYMSMPMGYQDAIRFIQSQGMDSSSRYGIYVRQMMSKNN
jgi:hypothetical protein